MRYLEPKVEQALLDMNFIGKYENLSNKYNELRAPMDKRLKYIDKLGNKLSEGKRSFTYDKHNNLSTATLNNKTVSYTYDKFNQITKVKDANVS